MADREKEARTAPRAVHHGALVRVHIGHVGDVEAFAFEKADGVVLPADWDLTDPALSREIEGYASKTSVNGGEPIELFVHTAGARYTIDVFRAGWYGGAGARRVAGPIDRTGVAQDVPAPDPKTGLIECAWRDPYRLDTGDGDGAWASGVYLARLTARPSGKQSFIVFVVRDDARESAMVFQSSVTTFAAYNNWGGKSLYGFNSGNAPARKVSFDRPYAANPYGVRLDGAGDFLRRRARFLVLDGRREGEGEQQGQHRLD